MRSIKTIVFIITAVAFMRCSNGGGTASTDNQKLGVQMWTFRLFSLAEGIQKADSAGIKNIEAFVGQPLGAGLRDSFNVNMTAESKQALKNLLKEKDMHIVAMGVIVPKTIEEWKQHFELAKEFDLSYITAEPLKDQWVQIDSLAGIYNIKVAIHDHPNPTAYWHPDSVLAAINGHPNIGACADVGHWARSGMNPVECLKKLEGHVYGVHLKDIKVFGQTDAADTLVGKGVIKFDEIFTELKRQNFGGMLSIEQESNWHNNMPDVADTRRFYESRVTELNE